MSTVKGAILGLLQQAYPRRDRVGLIAFRQERADLVLPPTNSPDLAHKQLRQLPTGGRTPLGAGLELAERVLERCRRQEDWTEQRVILVTDGGHNVGVSPFPAARRLARLGGGIIVVNSGSKYVGMEAAQRLAALLNARCIPLEALSAPLRTAP